MIAEAEAVRDGERLARLISQQGVNVMQGTPSTWALLKASAVAPMDHDGCSRERTVAGRFTAP